MHGALLVACSIALLTLVFVTLGSPRASVVATATPVSAAHATEGSLVAVMPFAVRGAAGDSAGLGLGAADLVSIGLHGAGELRSVPPSVLMPLVAVAGRDGFTPQEAADIARRFGATRYLVGEVVRDGDQLHVTASLHDVTRGSVLAQASVSGPAGHLGATADRLVLALLAQTLAGPADHLSRVAAASTSSLEALKAWLLGETFYRRQRYADAAAAFGRATASDPRFALAHYRLANTLDRLGESAAADSASARAVALADRVPATERELLRAWRAQRAGDVDAADARYEALLDDAPDHVEGWFALAELRFQTNPTRGHSVTEARRAFEHVLAIDPEHAEALI
jgi:hypothetical protein